MKMCRLLLALPPFLLSGTAVHAEEKPRLAMDVGASAGFSNNPFSQANGNSSSGYVTFDITPSVQLIQERSTITASVSAQVQQYFTQYPTTDSYRGSVAYSGRPAERVNTFLRVDVSSAILGTYDNLGPTTNAFNLAGSGTGGSTGTDAATAPATTVSPGLGGIANSAGFANDLGLFGTRERRRSVYANGGVTAGLSAVDTISASGFGDIARYRNFGGSNYDGFGGTVSYSRQLTRYSRVGLQSSYSRYSYAGVGGDTNVYSIQATGSTRINSFWTVDGALGVSFVDSRTAFGPTNRTSLSGNVRLCRQSELSGLCLSASRDAQATGSNGSQYVTIAGLSYDRRLSGRTRIGLSAVYVSQGGLQPLTNGQSDYVSVSPSYSRQLGERLQLQASLRYRQLFGGIQGQQSDYGGQLGLSYHFGRLR